ncbi:MAG: nitroreductase family protein [Pseudomonadota bacterium]
MQAPGPDAACLHQILEAAGAAPDHDQILPWRFVIVPAEARTALADAFEQALVERDPLAGGAQRGQAREKAFRAPLLMLAIVRLQEAAGHAACDITEAERHVSAGCAIQNMLLVATAQSFGSSLTSGKALQSAPLRTLFALGANERALCFINIGTIASQRPLRRRPAPDAYVTTLAVSGPPDAQGPAINVP